LRLSNAFRLIELQKRADSEKVLEVMKWIDQLVRLENHKARTAMFAVVIAPSSCFADDVFGSFYRESRHIELRGKTQGIRLTIAHEIGHALDFLGEGFILQRDTKLGFASELPHLAHWREAVLTNPCFDRLYNSVNSNTVKKVALAFRELFARSFEQWVATNAPQTSDIRLEWQRFLQDFDLIDKGSYWKPEEFISIAQALERDFEVMGVKCKKQLENP
jgi:hypothetical protein